ncbi:MAG: glutaredoxin family protein [Thermoleophilia bacterium]
MRRVVVYGADGCHLCASALAVLERVRAEQPFELVEVMIDGDGGLEARYRERIPVVELDGVELFTYFVHPDVLRARLAAPPG